MNHDKLIKVAHYETKARFSKTRLKVLTHINLSEDPADSFIEFLSLYIYFSLFLKLFKKLLSCQYFC